MTERLITDTDLKKLNYFSDMKSEDAKKISFENKLKLIKSPDHLQITPNINLDLLSEGSEDELIKHSSRRLINNKQLLTKRSVTYGHATFEKNY